MDHYDSTTHMFLFVVQDYAQHGMESTTISTMERLLRQQPTLVHRLITCGEDRSMHVIEIAIQVCERCALLSQIDPSSIRAKANYHMSLDVLELVVKCMVKTKSPTPSIHSNNSDVRGIIGKYY